MYISTIKREKLAKVTSFSIRIENCHKKTQLSSTCSSSQTRFENKFGKQDDRQFTKYSVIRSGTCYDFAELPYTVFGGFTLPKLNGYQHQVSAIGYL